MIAAGGCHAVNSLAWLNSHTLADLFVPWILLPCLAGELSLAAWLRG